MKRSSTPTHTFTLPFDYQGFCERFMLSYGQIVRGAESIVLQKTESDIGSGVFVEGDTIRLTLTQEETLLFEGASAIVEMKVYTKDKKVLISDKVYVPVQDVLNDEVFK